MFSLSRFGRVLALPLLFTSALGVAADVATDTAVSDDKMLNDCVWIPRIDRIRIVDDRSFLVYLRGKKIYLNQLSHRCPGMRPGKTFMYRTSLSKLCHYDTITLLDNHGFGFHRGASCGLGKFEEIDQAQAKALVSKKPKPLVDSSE